MSWCRAMLVGLATLAVAPACVSRSEAVHEAKNSAYDAKYRLVFRLTSEVVREQYAKGAEFALEKALIKTAWHPIQLLEKEAPRNPGYEPPQVTQGAEPGPGSPTTSERRSQQNWERNRRAFKQKKNTRYFVRFDVRLSGGGPWRIDVQGHGSEWEAGMTPRPFKADEMPPWVAQRADSLRLAIHQRLQQYAVPAKKVAAAGE